MPTWTIQLSSLLLGVGAICVLVADSADVTWALDGGVSAILGGMATGLAAWQIKPPGQQAKPKVTP